VEAASAGMRIFSSLGWDCVPARTSTPPGELKIFFVPKDKTMISAWRLNDQLDLAMWGLRTKMALQKTNPGSLRGHAKSGIRKDVPTDSPSWGSSPVRDN